MMQVADCLRLSFFVDFGSLDFGALRAGTSISNIYLGQLHSPFSSPLSFFSFLTLLACYNQSVPAS